MADAFAAQFFLLVGIDIFLGGSIIAVMLEDHFPKSLPYILDIGSFVGFAQLLIGPQYLSSFSSTLQFYYCFGFLSVAVLSIAGLNLYLFLLKGNLVVSAVVAMVATTPSILSAIFFQSAYVNGISLSLPLIPVLSMSAIYVLFSASAIILLTTILLAVPNVREKIQIRPKVSN